MSKSKLERWMKYELPDLLAQVSTGLMHPSKALFLITSTIEAALEERWPKEVGVWGHGKMITSGVRDGDRFGLRIQRAERPHTIGEACPGYGGTYGERVEWQPGDQVMWFDNQDGLRIVVEDLLTGASEMGWSVHEDILADKEEEQGRWQRAIYEECKRVLPDVDGSGCDSGDPLDVTLEEIRACFTHLQEWREALERDRIIRVLRSHLPRPRTVYIGWEHDHISMDLSKLPPHHGFWGWLERVAEAILGQKEKDND